MKGLIGKKLGMTQVFDENGVQVPVTVLAVGPCVVVQRKTADRDGYDAIQLGYAEQKPHRLSKALVGHFHKAGATPCRVLCEFYVTPEDERSGGEEVTVSEFEQTGYVDVSGVTKGRGFQGVVKRHGMRGQPASHGSTSHRRIGAIGGTVAGLCATATGYLLATRVFRIAYLPAADIVLLGTAAGVAVGALAALAPMRGIMRSRPQALLAAG